MIFPTQGRSSGQPRYVYLTNRRWTLAALGFAAACKLTEADTVFCALPLRAPINSALVAGGALAGGARLAIASPKQDAASLWAELRRYGATVLPYDASLIDAMLTTPARHAGLRCVVGQGLRAPRWQALRERLGDAPQIIEFWCCAEGNACLVNMDDEKPGAVGRPLPGLDNIELVRRGEDGALLRDERGRLIRCEEGEIGAIIARVDDRHPLWRFDGLLDPEQEARAILESPFGAEDHWLDLGAQLRRDAEGDYWLDFL
jgi:acyl-CoA synthetase (AMP-forming)/AMP-acid ligase II